jgi:hypothetical protein
MSYNPIKKIQKRIRTLFLATRKATDTKVRLHSKQRHTRYKHGGNLGNNLKQFLV